MNHVMLDIDTMSNKSNAAIIQIGAVQFNPYTGDVRMEFEVNIDITSCLLAGLDVNPETVQWWRGQSEDAKKALMAGQKYPLSVALKNFTAFVEGLNCKYGPFVWGNGSDFDNVILTNAYEALNMKRPWHYRNDRDVRTLVALGKTFGINPFEEKRTGTYHRGIDDCKYQIGYCSKIWMAVQSLKEKKSTGDFKPMVGNTLEGVA